MKKFNLSEIIFKARYAALVSCVQGGQSAAQGSF